MKKALQLCCLLMGLTTVSYAQVSHLATAAPEQKAKGLQKYLTLTNDQTAKVAAIYKESAQKFEIIKTAQHSNSDKMANPILSLRAVTIKKIKGVLTPQQAAKFDGMIKQAKKNGGIDWGGGWSTRTPAKSLTDGHFC